MEVKYIKSITTNMKHALISPTNYLHLIPEESNFHLLLAHLLDDDAYASFYRKRQEAGDFIIIDNGAFENKVPLPVDKYYKLVNDSGITPDVVVAPDYPFEDWEKTVDSTRDFVASYGNYFDINRTNVMAVPQSVKGDHLGWIKAYSEFALLEDVEFIGMSILGIPNAFCSLTGTDAITYNRVFASIYLKENELVCDKKHHYLGCDEPRELLMQKLIGVAYSNDSSTAFWHAINGISFDKTASGLVDGKTKIPVDFDIPFNSADVPLIKSNMRWLNELMNSQ